MALNFKEEYLKCYQDKTRQYFIRKYLTTFNADIKEEVPFDLFPRQVCLLDSFVTYPNTIAIKHRQAGITTVAGGWAAGQCVFANPKSPETILCIGNKLDISQQLVEKIAYFLDQVPRWMWGADYWSPDPKSEKNTRSIYKTRNKDRIELFNGCKIYARSSGANAARGISAVSILIFDEAAFIENGMSVYAQAVAATSSVKDAKTIMISTPNGKDQLYYGTYHKALSGENNYHPVEFKWFQDPRYNRYLKWYRKDEESGEVEWIEEEVVGKRGEIPYNEERWNKLEKDGWKPISPWYEKMCQTLNNDRQRIAQELDVSFLGSSDNVIPPDIINMHKTMNVVKLDDKWPLRDRLTPETWIWEDPIPGHRYICAVDPSTGASDDRSAIEILDVDAVDENGMPYVNQVLEYYGKRTGDEIGQLTYKYATFYNNAFVVVECLGAYGDSVVIQLMNLKYTNMYYDDAALKTYTAQRNRKRSNHYKPKDERLPGLRTNSIRPQMIANFATSVVNNAIHIRSERVIMEMDTWVYKNGRPDHMTGFHDDALMCLSLGMFIMEFYMLKQYKDRSMSQTMLHSWRTNNTSTQDYSSRSLKDNVDISKKRRMPIYSNATKERERKGRLSAMIMLGGFGHPSKNS